MLLKMNRMVMIFIITPVLIRNLGFYDYGIWEVVISLIGYVGFINLGLPSSIVKFVAQAEGESDIGYSRILFKKAMGYMLVASFLVASILLIFNFYLFDVFPSKFLEDKSRYQLFLVLIALFIICSFFHTVVMSTVEGFQAFDVKAKVIIPISIVINIVIWLFISENNALILLTTTSISSLVLSSTILVFFLQHRYRIINGESNARRAFNINEVISFSLKSFVQGAVYKIQDTVAPILVSSILTPASVVFYSVPKNLIGHKRDIELTITQVFLPYFSFMNSNGGNLVRDYYRFSLILLIITLPIGLGVLFLGKEFLGLWVGNEIASNASFVIATLALSSILGGCDPLASKLITSQNKHGIYAKLAPFQLLLFLAVSLPLLTKLGIDGIAIAVMLNSLIFPFIYMKYRVKLMGDSIRTYFFAVHMKTLLPVTAFVCVITCLKNIIIIDSYAKLLFAATVSTICFLLTSFLFSLNDSERKVIISSVFRTRSR